MKSHDWTHGGTSLQGSGGGLRGRNLGRAAGLVLLLCLRPGVGVAGLPEAINQARLQGCGVAGAPLTELDSGL